jgi:glutamate/aspartate transport system substrate-binding protein
MQRLVLLVSLVLIGSSAIAAKNSGTLKKVADTGVFTIGYHENSPPFSFLDDAAEPVGYSVDLCRRIAAAVKENLGLKKLKVEFESVTLEGRMKAVESGKVDIVCGSDTITLSRQEQVDFTLMTFVTGGALLSKAGSGIQMTADLTGRSVAVAKGTTTEAALVAYLGASLIDAQVVTVADDWAAINSLNKGEVDAFASDQIVLIGQIIQSPDPRAYAMSQDLFSYEPYGLMVRRNDADFRLVANRALSTLYRTDQYKKLYDRWFGRSGVQPSQILAAMYKLQGLPE